MEYYKRNEEMSLFPAMEYSPGHIIKQKKKKKSKHRKYAYYALFMKRGVYIASMYAILLHFFNGKTNPQTKFFFNLFILFCLFLAAVGSLLLCTGFL